MNNQFLLYLICIVLVMLILAVISAFILFRIMRSRHSAGNTATAPEGIYNGNVSVLFDENKNVIVIPYAKDKYGTGRAVRGPQRLSTPYSAVKLGNLIRNTMNLCEKGVVCTSHELMAQLGFHDWKDFSEGKRSISLNCIEGQGLVFNTTVRTREGAYRFNSLRAEYTAGNNISDKELGEAVLSLLERCKC